MRKQKNGVIQEDQALSADGSEIPNLAKGERQKKSRILQVDIPVISLDQALRIPRAIFEQYAGKEVTPLQLGLAIEIAPTSGGFRTLTGAAAAYGLTEGAYNASLIKPTEISQRIFRPLEEGADIDAKRQAFMTPRVIGDFLRKYDGNALPRKDIAINVLLSLGVPQDRLESVYELITSGAKSCHLITEMKGKEYVQLSVISPVNGGALTKSLEEVEDLPDTAHQVQETSNRPTDVMSPTQTENKRVFITHGKNKSLIEPIKKLVAFGELEAVVAVESASVSKPVPDKVMADMRSCSGAIIHVDAERELIDKDGNVFKILNENVLIEIGAAMALYGRRFILLVRDGVTLPSNLQGLFEVRYQADDLGATKTIELLDAISKLKKEPLVRG